MLHDIQHSETDPSLARALAAGKIETPDPEHSRHVAHLSLRLYDLLQEPLALPREGRDLLAAAALWHDCGQMRSMADHHRYSFDRIMAVPLRGFSREEQLQIANIARYHRAAHPSPQHPGYQRLPRSLRPAVDQMAAILRIAEGLDAGHLQVIKDVDVEVHDRYVTIYAISDTYPTMEIERAQSRAALFREVFGRDVEILPKVIRSRTGRPVEGA